MFIRRSTDQITARADEQLLSICKSLEPTARTDEEALAALTDFEKNLTRVALVKGAHDNLVDHVRQVAPSLSEATREDATATLDAYVKVYEGMFDRSFTVEQIEEPLPDPDLGPPRDDEPNTATDRPTPDTSSDR